MWCGVVTLFPEMFKAITESGITHRAIQRGLLTLSCWNPRDFANDKHKTVDDRPFGGGPGMVMGVYPLRSAIQSAIQAAKTEGAKNQAPPSIPPKTIYVSPQGKPFTQSMAQTCATLKQPLLFVAGRYEGVDERLIELEIDEEWSLGDYVISGGELAAMVMIDAITRLLPGALGHEDSAQQDSFSIDHNLLDCPHYTRPETVDGRSVPSVLLSGDHQAIARWRFKQRLGRTFLRRPDLFQKISPNLDKEHQMLLQEFLNEHKMQEDL